MKVYPDSMSKKEKTANKTFGLISIAILIAAVYLTLAGSTLAVKINKWQIGFMGGNKYFPVLTMFLLAIPPLLLLALVKLLVIKGAKKN
jgi:hypothetical protein